MTVGRRTYEAEQVRRDTDRTRGKRARRPADFPAPAASFIRRGPGRSWALLGQKALEVFWKWVNRSRPMPSNTASIFAWFPFLTAEFSEGHQAQLRNDRRQAVPDARSSPERIALIGTGLATSAEGSQIPYSGPARQLIASLYRHNYGMRILAGSTE